MTTRRPMQRGGMACMAVAVAVVGAAISLPVAPSASAAPAGVATAIDTSFGGGFVTTNASSLDDEVFAVATQPDGATVVAGRTKYDPFAFTGGDIIVARHTAAGPLDPTFGTGGSVVFGTPSAMETAKAVALQPDGKIVIGGWYANQRVVIRLTPTGALDPTFQGGIVTFAEGWGSIEALAIHDDGKIAFAANGVTMGRVNPDGSRDTGYGTNGIVAAPDFGTTVPGYNGIANDATTFSLLPDGGLLVGGYSSPPEFAGGPATVALLVRYLPTGGLDRAFGTNGVVTTNLDTTYVDRGTQILAMTVQPDGRIVAAGQVYIRASAAGVLTPGVPTGPPPPSVNHISLHAVALFRYLPDGRLDTTFAGTGHVIYRVPGQAEPGSDYRALSVMTPPETDAEATAVTLDPSGAILVGGWSSQPKPEPLVLRFTPSGLLDPTFGRNGVVSVDRGGLQGQVNAMAVGSDGTLTVAGRSRPGFWYEPPNYSDLLVGRIIPGSSAGSVWAWGWNALGQVGDGTITSRPRPVQVPGLSGMVAVAAGPYHTLALRGDGTVWAWGWNSFGQLGDGSTVDKRSPVQVLGLTGITAIAAGAYHSLALKGDGTVVAWGWNGYGAVGDGTVSTRVRPTQVFGLRGVVSISAGLLHNLALREDGTGWAWGFNALGQLGDGTTTDRHVPVQLPPNYNNYAYVSLNAGWLHSLSRDALGAGNTWGYNNVGQVAGGGQGGFTTTPGTSTITGMEESAGGYHNFKVQRDGTVNPSGWDGLGQLGNGPGGPVKGLSLLNSISAGGYHSLAVTTDRQLWAWGWNYFGQLGTGTARDADVPQKVTGVPNAVVVGAGGYHSIAIQG